jgi:hypothetical protein
MLCIDQQWLKNVIDWVSNVITDIESEMRGIVCGRLYETYHKTAYNSKTVSDQLKKLYADSYIKNRRGIFEYILSGSSVTKLLEVSVFDEATKKSVYAKKSRSRKKRDFKLPAVCNWQQHKQN